MTIEKIKKILDKFFGNDYIYYAPDLPTELNVSTVFDNRIVCPAFRVTNIKMTEWAYSAMLNYMMLVSESKNSEVYGLLVGNNSLVTRTILPKQSVDGSGCGITAIDASKIKFKEGERFLGWWHSHHNFAVFLSGEDIDNINKLMVVHKKLYSIVLNRKGEIKCWLSQKISCGETITTEVPIKVLIEPNTIYLEKYKKEVKENVKSSFPFFSRQKKIKIVKKGDENGKHKQI